MILLKETAFFNILLRAVDGVLVSAELNPAEITNDGGNPADGAVLAAASGQLDEYLSGVRRGFDLPLAPRGTLFQQKVWRALLDIPYGETRSYGFIANAAGNALAARAVGMANNRNPLPVFIPCHRVIGCDGSMVGYGAGLDIKITLLKLENRYKNG